jgi:arabinogalactan oligomer/maltooligosaccharide transport system substrate-binding protein
MKKTLSIVISAALLLLAFAGCGSSSPSDSTPGGASPSGGGASPSSPTGQTYDLLVWGPVEDQPFLDQVIAAFKAANPGNTYNITTGVVGEGDARARLSEDPEAGADVFIFPDDQIHDMVNAGLLYEVTRDSADVIARNTAASVDSATLDGKLWAYPATSDNGYFFYYDKSLLTESDVASLDGIIAKCNSLGKKFTYPINNSWIIASFFLVNGNLGLADGKQLCDFNNADGLAAAQAMQAMVDSGAWAPGWDAELNAGIGDTFAGGVGGMWMAETIKGVLGDNYAATKLPTATISGRQQQLSSFRGCKLMGVNSQTKSPVAAFDFANFITGEAMQLLRLELRGLGPSNKNLQTHDLVSSNLALTALAQQAEFAHSQRDTLGVYWGPAEAFGTAITNKDTTPLQDLLDAMVAQITA